MELILVSNLENFFCKHTETIPCLESTRAYICGVFKEANKKDLSDQILTLVYAKAKFEHRFELFQNLGDWILISKVMFPEYLNEPSQSYYDAIAQSSYDKCYRMLERKWKLYEELADRFPEIASALNAKLCEIAVV